MMMTLTKPKLTSNFDLCLEILKAMHDALPDHLYSSLFKSSAGRNDLPTDNSSPFHRLGPQVMCVIQAELIPPPSTCAKTCGTSNTPPKRSSNTQNR